MDSDVFISYSNKDKNAADAVCSIMEQNGIRCWMAPRNITPGLPFAEAIIDGIKDSRIFVLIYSSNSNNSSQVIKEVDRAVQYKLAIIPFRLEDVPMTKQLEYYVSNVHWMDALTPPLDEHIEKLCRVVKILLTHGHADHAAGAAGLREALGLRVLAARPIAEALRRGDESVLSNLCESLFELDAGLADDFAPFCKVGPDKA